MIYVVWATKTPYVKIGYTRQAPANRVASFRTGCPHQLELLYTTTGNRDLESFLHTKLAAIQCPGGKEWFDLRKVPSFQECRFCDISVEDCPDRVEVKSEGGLDCDLF